MNRALVLDVHGVVVAIDGDDDALARLAIHFEAFVAARAGRAGVTVRLVRARPTVDLPAGHRADQIVDRGLVYNLGPVTIVDHHGHATSVYDFAADAGSVTATSVDDLVELGYLMVSSRLGVHLEAHGLVRVHGIGLAVDGRAALVLAPSGGGKSTLARALLRATDASLLGDDLVLLDRRGRVHPFPTPIGVTDPAQAEGLGPAVPFPRRLHEPKWMIPVDAIRGRYATEAMPLAAVVVLRRVVGDRAELRRVRRAEVAGPLARDAIVGLGLPQVIELVVRRGPRDLVRMAPSAARRALAVSSALARAEGYELCAGRPDAAAVALVAALRAR